MGNLDFKQFSERHRPHIHTPGKTLFVTYRLAGSIPKATLREYKAKKDWLENELRRVRNLADGHETPELKQQLERVEQYNREWFVKFEDTLHKAHNGPMWMQDDRVAGKVAENLHRLDGDAYTLDAFCMMSNHVHTVFKPLLSETDLKESFDEDGHLTRISH